MNARRRFLQHSSAVLGAFLLTPLLSACEGGDGTGGGGSSGGTPQPGVQLQLHEEGAPHQATWMAFPGSSIIWGGQLAGVQDAIARISKAIVDFEPVNMLVNPADLALAQQKVDSRVTLIPAPLDDLWMRDTGPVFAYALDGSKVAVGFNFNGWGNKPAPYQQPHANDATVAATVASKSGALFVASRLTLEGGGMEWDGAGTAIITESCVLNSNRNQGLSKADCEAELAKIGIRKVIWLPGIAGRDITDGHTDFYARFAGPGVVIAGLENDPAQYDYAVTRKHLDILKAATDANGKPLQVYTLPGPNSVRQPNNAGFAAGYINYYLCNGGLIMPQFGDPSSDASAKSLMQQLYPGRTVVQLDIDPIAAGGGGIHCTTQQQPK